LRAQAFTDHLTGLPNRHGWDERARVLFDQAQRHDSPLALIMLDLDHFKRINDKFGHPEGDRVLVDVARTLEATCRRNDLPARYGGEEFVAVLPGTTLNGARFVAEQMRQAISQLAIAHPGTPFAHLTASFGVASAVAMPETDPQDIVAAAELALLKAKNEGRNRVCETSSLDPQDN